MPHDCSHRDFLERQYGNSQNLSARADLYRRFGTSTYGWFDDRLDLPKNGSVLELGCGHGLLWRKCIDRVDSGWSVILSDVSPGMVADAKRALAGSREAAFEFAVIDAQAIPLGAGTFDAVIANHVLYHVPNRLRALKEIHRVLKPSGRLIASTVGEGHLAEIRSLIRRFDPRLLERDQDVLFGFTLQSGEPELDAIFDTVDLELYDDSLVVTEFGPLLEYVRSRVDTELLSPQLDEFRAFLGEEFRRMNGSIHISTETGMFLAAKASA